MGGAVCFTSVLVFKLAAVVGSTALLHLDKSHQIQSPAVRPTFRPERRCVTSSRLTEEHLRSIDGTFKLVKELLITTETSCYYQEKSSSLRVGSVQGPFVMSPKDTSQLMNEMRTRLMFSRSWNLSDWGH